MKIHQLVAFNDTNGNSLVNASATSFVDVRNVYVSYKVMGKTNEATNTFDFLIFQGTITSCNIARGMNAFFFVKPLLEGFKKYSNFTITCPEEKGTYYVANFPMIDNYIIPPILLGLIGKQRILEVRALMKGKIDNITTMVHLGDFKSYLSINPN